MYDPCCRDFTLEVITIMSVFCMLNCADPDIML